MKMKSENLLFNWEEIEFDINWTLYTKVEDITEDSWYRTMEYIFKDWDEIIWPHTMPLSLPILYEDMYPEFINYVNWEIEFNKEEFDKYFPNKKLTFNIPNNIDINWFEYENTIAPPVLNNKKKTPPTKQSPDLYKELYDKLYKELYDEIYKDLYDKIYNKEKQLTKKQLTKKQLEELNINKIIQIDKNWNILWYFNSAVEAAKKLNIAASSISAVLKKKRKSAWWFIFIFNNNPQTNNG